VLLGHQFAELFDDLGMFGGNVVLLADIGLEIVELDLEGILSALA